MKNIITVIVIVMSVTFLSCAMPSGYLPIHHRVDSGLSMREVRSDSEGYRTYAIHKIANNTNIKFHGEMVCTFTTQMGRKEFAYNEVILNPYEWKEYYSSVPLASRFKIDLECRISSETL